jgi:hypothetical protein
MLQQRFFLEILSFQLYIQQMTLWLTASWLPLTSPSDDHTIRENFLK